MRVERGTLGIDPLDGYYIPKVGDTVYDIFDEELVGLIDIIITQESSCGACGDPVFIARVVCNCDRTAVHSPGDYVILVGYGVEGLILEK